jgi:two-component system OmpR family sensor kinase
MYEARGISLTSLEKRSFYSFVALYLGSSFLFVLLSGFWYYSAQKNALENETYYKLEHFADRLSGLIINAHMMGKRLALPKTQEFEYELIRVDEKTAYKVGYYEKGDVKILVTDAPRKHLNIAYVVVKTKSYFEKLSKLQVYVLSMMGIVFVFVGFVLIFLSKLFMKPIQQRIEQIESFVQDVSHELNTPITALKMSSSRAIKKGVYDKKILTNISISTKQLETIYNSLTYLNFSNEQELVEDLQLDEVIQRVVDYYEELSSTKKIAVVVELEPFVFSARASRMELLFSNLLSNAIKYSMPETTIRISLKDGLFSIKDEGVGIAQEKLNAIFELYQRDSQIAGGFGVGLSIVKQICDEYEIEVSVSSELEVGSEFRLALN